MNNLHRELAPISESAWSQIEDEATRTLKRHLAARRVVDVHGPKGFDLAAVGTGHIRRLQAVPESASVSIREVRPVVELVVPFDLDRQAIDDVERGAMDSDWQPVKDAAKNAAERPIAGLAGCRVGTVRRNRVCAAGHYQDDWRDIRSTHCVDGARSCRTAISSRRKR